MLPSKVLTSMLAQWVIGLITCEMDQEFHTGQGYGPPLDPQKESTDPSEAHRSTDLIEHQKEMFDNISLQIENINNTLIQEKNLRQESQSQMQKLENNLKQLPDKLNSDFDLFKADINKTSLLINETFVRQNGELKTLQENQSEFRSQVKKLETDLQHLDLFKADINTKCIEINETIVTQNGEMKTLQENLKELQSEVKNIETETEKQTENLNQLTADIKEKGVQINENFETQNKQFNSLQENQNKIQSQMEKLETDLQQSTKKQTENINQLKVDIHKKGVQIDDKFETQNKQMNSLQENQNKLQSEVKIIETETHKQTEDLDQFKANISQLNQLTANINKILLQINETFETQNGLLNTLQEKQDNLQSQMGKLETDFQLSTEKLTNDLEQIRADTGEKNLRNDQMFESLNRQLNTLRENQGKLQSQVGKLQTDLQQSTEKQTKNLNQFQVEASQISQSFNQKLELQNETFLEKLEEIQKMVEIRTQSMETDLKDSFQTELAKIQSALDVLKQEFEHSEDQQNSRIRKTYTKAVEIESDVKYRQQDIFDRIAYFTCGFTLCVSLCVLLYSVYWPKDSGPVHQQRIGTAGQQPAGSSPAESNNMAVYQPPGNSPTLKTCGHLSPSVCVVGFSDVTISDHKKLALSVCPSGVTVHTYVVHSLSGISDTPRDAISIVCVDFNERNVILEEPGLLQGELRSETVHHLQHIGSEVFVIYVRDKGSRNLRPGDLYNTSLTSVQRHRQLSILEKRGRVLSVHSSFAQTQKILLSRKIDSLCKSE